jgi:hypothetical protein
MHNVEKTRNRIIKMYSKIDIKIIITNFIVIHQSNIDDHSYEFNYYLKINKKIF